MRAGKPVEKDIEKKKKLDYIIEEDLNENKRFKTSYGEY